MKETKTKPKKDPNYARFNRNRINAGARLACACGRPAISADSSGPFCAVCARIERRGENPNGSRSKYDEPSKRRKRNRKD